MQQQSHLFVVSFIRANFVLKRYFASKLLIQKLCVKIRNEEEKSATLHCGYINWNLVVLICNKILHVTGNHNIIPPVNLT